MLILPRLHRRGVLAGGLSLGVAACSPKAQPQTSAAAAAPQAMNPQDVTLGSALIGVGAQGAEIIGSFLGLGKLAKIAGLSAGVAEFVKLLSELWPEVEPQPDPANPVPVPFLVTPRIEIRVNIANTTPTPGLILNVYSMLLPVGVAPPKDAASLTGDKALPSFSVALGIGESFSQAIPSLIAGNAGYVTHVWAQPSTVEFDDQFVAENRMAGPALYSCDPADLNLIRAIRAQADSDLLPELSRRFAAGSALTPSA